MEDNPPTASQPVQTQDYNSFPALQGMDGGPWNPYANQHHSNTQSGPLVTPPPGLRARPYGDSDDQFSNSRPSSVRQSRQSTPSVPAVDDNEAFPSLGDMSAKATKKTGSRRGLQGKLSRDSLQGVPNSLADVVRMSPSSAAGAARKGIKNKSFAGTRENSIAAQAIPPPQHIPWLETGESANKAYLKARQEAIKHGGLRNKFLQRYAESFQQLLQCLTVTSAAQAWNRNDSRAAKALSLRGQSENDLMRKAHREAASQLYDERNSNYGANQELFIDLHGKSNVALNWATSKLYRRATSRRSC